jgi:hypothetical protein
MLAAVGDAVWPSSGLEGALAGGADFGGAAATCARMTDKTSAGGAVAWTLWEACDSSALSRCCACEASAIGSCSTWLGRVGVSAEALGLSRRLTVAEAAAFAGDADRDIERVRAGFPLLVALAGDTEPDADRLD